MRLGLGTSGLKVLQRSVLDVADFLAADRPKSSVLKNRRQLSRMAIQAQEAMGQRNLTVIADRGYYQSEEIYACDEAGITPYLPKPHTSPNQSKGLFARDAFHYLPKNDEYRCPARKRLIWRFQTVEHGLTLTPSFFVFKLKHYL